MKFLDNLLGKGKKIQIEAASMEYPEIMKTYFKEASEISEVSIGSTNDLLQYFEGVANDSVNSAIAAFDTYCNLRGKLSKAETEEKYRVARIKHERLAKITNDEREQIKAGELENTGGRQEPLSEADKKIKKLHNQIVEYETQTIEPIKIEFIASKPGVIDAMDDLKILDQLRELTNTTYINVCRADLKKADMEHLPSELKSISSKLDAYWDKYRVARIRADRLMSIEKEEEEWSAKQE